MRFRTTISVSHKKWPESKSWNKKHLLKRSVNTLMLVLLAHILSSIAMQNFDDTRSVSGRFAPKKILSLTTPVLAENSTIIEKGKFLPVDTSGNAGCHNFPIIFS